MLDREDRESREVRRTGTDIGREGVPIAEVAEARERMKYPAIALGRFTFQSTFEDKNVPAEYQPVVRECMARYTHEHHANTGADNPNMALFHEYPEVEDYMVERMALVGTVPECRERIEQLRDEAGLDGLWFTLTNIEQARQLGASCAGLLGE